MQASGTMQRSLFGKLTTIALICLVYATARADTPVEDGPRIERLAEGIYAAIQPPARAFNDSNSLIVIQPDGVIVVDAQEDAGFVRALIEQVRELTDKPIRGLINTHWHGDHTQGNGIFRTQFGDTLKIYGHQTLGEDIPDRAAKQVAERVEQYETIIPEAERQLADGKSRKGEPLTAEQQVRQREAIAQAKQWLAANRDLEFVVPTLTYEKTLTVGRGKTRLELRHFRAHTRGDTVVWLPEAKIMASGDLLDAMPYVGHGYPSEWVETLKTLRGYDVETIVPGHGPVYRGKDQLDKVLAYLQSVVEQVRAAVEQQKSLEQTLELVDLEQTRSALVGEDPAFARFFDAVLPEAIERAWLEARGEIE